MGLKDTLELIISADVKGAVKGFEEVGASAERNMTKTASGMERTGASMQKAGGIMIGVGAIAVAAFGELASEGEKATLSTARLQSSVEHAGEAAGGSIEPFAALAEEMAKKTEFDHLAIQASEAQQLQIGLTKDKVLELTPLIADLAAKQGIDLVTATDKVTKALLGKKKGLESVLGPLDAAKFATDRYGAVQDLLTQKVGGFAEVQGKTFTGQLEIMKNKLKDLEEGVGQGAVKAFSALFDGIDFVTGALDSLSPGMQGTIGEVGTFLAVGTLAAGVLTTIAGTVVKSADGIAKMAQALGLLNVAEVEGEAASVGLMTALGPVGVAAAAVAATIGFVALVNSQDDGAKSTKEYTAAIEDQNGALDNNVDKVTADALAHNDIAKQANASGISFKLLGETVRTGTDDFGAYRTATNNAHAGFIPLVGALTDAGAGTTEFGRALLKAAADGTLTGDQIGSLVLNVEHLQHGYRDATATTNEQKDAEKALGITTGDLNQATIDLIGAIKEEQDTLKAGLDPLFAVADATHGLEKAQQAARTAQDAVTAAVAKYGAGSPEAVAAAGAFTDAQYAVGKAAESQEVAIANLTAKVADGSVTFLDAEAKLGQWVAQGKLTQAQADVIAASFKTAMDHSDAFGRSLGALPKNVDINVNVHENIIAGGKSTASGQLPTIGRVVTFGLGGPVEAPKGKPVLAIVHGGEYVSTAEEVEAAQHRTRGGGIGDKLAKSSKLGGGDVHYHLTAVNAPTSREVIDEFAWAVKLGKVS